MKPKELKPKDCCDQLGEKAGGYELRSTAISRANHWTKIENAQHRVIKIDGRWYVYNAVKHH
jgi:hypothetical protein